MAPPGPDGDGVTYEDRCPHEPGPIENNGCPMSYFASVVSCIERGVAAATTFGEGRLPAVRRHGGNSDIGSDDGSFRHYHPGGGGAAAWAPIASLAATAGFGLLCACIIRG